jgi:prevent-host-death family protein
VAQSVQRSGVKQVPLSEINNDLSRFLREAEGEDIVITRNGKLAGLLIAFASEDDWLDYQLENDPRFLRRIERARKSLREGHGVKIEDVE